MDSSELNDKPKQKHSARALCTPNKEAAIHFPDTMSPEAAAAYLGIRTATLANWRSTNRYPLPYIKVGRLVQYRKKHLDDFLAHRTVGRLE